MRSTRRGRTTLVLLLVYIWAALITVKRWFVPRGFRVVLRRVRCVECNRRLRPAIRRVVSIKGPICTKCSNLLRRKHPQLRKRHEGTEKSHPGHHRAVR